MKFVLLALFVVSSSAFANSEVKKVTTEKTETKPDTTVESKTSTKSEKEEECVVVDGEEDCKTVHSKDSNKTKSKKKSY